MTVWIFLLFVALAGAAIPVLWYGARSLRQPTVTIHGPGDAAAARRRRRG